MLWINVNFHCKILNINMTNSGNPTIQIFFSFKLLFKYICPSFDKII